jgi:hypothetical protein
MAAILAAITARDYHQKSQPGSILGSVAAAGSAQKLRFLSFINTFCEKSVGKAAHDTPKVLFPLRNIYMLRKIFRVEKPR